MGNAQDTQSGAVNGQNGIQTPPERPPRPTVSHTGSSVYPSLNDGDHDYEILRPGHTPSRPAPPTPHPPFTHQHSTHTLSNFHALDGVPFIVNPKFLNSTTPNKLLFPTIKARTMQQLLKDYDYSFTVERQT